MLDIDFRPDQWHDPRAFGVAIRSVLRHVDVVIGTQDEINAAMLTDPAQMSLTHSQVSDTRVKRRLDAAIARLHRIRARRRAVIEKRGEEGARIHLRDVAGNRRAGLPGRGSTNILGAGAYAFARRVPLRLYQGLGLVPRGAAGQRLWRDRRHQARLRELHADLWIG